MAPLGELRRGAIEILATDYDEGNDETKKGSQRKRALVLTAFLACLSFLIFGINALISFALDLAESENLWHYLNHRLNLTNTNCSEPCPK